MFMLFSFNSIFSSLARAGKTVIVVTHENNTALRYQRVVNLKDGEIELQNPLN